MEFIRDNYIWFIVGGVILIMAVIGYIADKTDFGRKRNEKKDDSNHQESLKVEAKGISEIANDVNGQIYGANSAMPINDELENVVEQPEISDNFTFDNNQVVDEALFAPLQANETIENNVVEIKEENNEEKELNSNLEEEDVWKF